MKFQLNENIFGDPEEKVLEMYGLLFTVKRPENDRQIFRDFKKLVKELMKKDLNKWSLYYNDRVYTVFEYPKKDESILTRVANRNNTGKKTYYLYIELGVSIAWRDYVQDIITDIRDCAKKAGYMVLRTILKDLNREDADLEMHPYGESLDEDYLALQFAEPSDEPEKDVSDTLTANACITDLLHQTIEMIQQLNCSIAGLKDSDKEEAIPILNDLLMTEKENMGKLESALGMYQDVEPIISGKQDGDSIIEDHSFIDPDVPSPIKVESLDPEDEATDVKKLREANSLFESLLADTPTKNKNTSKSRGDSLESIMNELFSEDM